MNVMGIVNVLQASVNAKVERFVYASTMYVYSSHGSFYRASKQCAEIIIEAYSDEFALDYTLLRYGSLYGPRAQEWNGLRKYVEQVVKKERLDYRGTGRERREYIHVIDAAILSVKVLDDAHRNRAITVTGHQILDSKTLIDMIFEISNVDPKKIGKFIPTGLVTLTVRLNQKVSKNKTSKEIFYGVLEEQFLFPLVSIPAIGLYLSHKFEYQYIYLLLLFHNC